MTHPPRTALLLGGGGARAAYQAGVLKAIGELLPEPARNPFPLLCGTSGGTINAAVLAMRARDFGAAVGYLVDFWSNIHAGDVYRADGWGMAEAGIRRFFGRNPHSLLDNAPLRRLLEMAVDFEQLEPAVADHALLALSVTCSGYASGQSVSFFQGRADLEPWSVGQRVGAHVMLGIDHLLASSAIPFIFPAVRMNREFFGDGALRQLSPLSPAIHLGADKIMVISDDPMADVGEEREPGETYPSLARVAGHTLAGIYSDPLTAELERPRSAEVLAILPSQRLDHLAAEHVGALPRPVRALLSGSGALTREGGALASYLLFEPPYTKALIDLGHGDALARQDDIRHFLDIA
ncbi:MAG: patatin-like phospholipase family protein [Gammaproteobacteria bacterium]|nr:patatin-like phospholipase family protein [Gammaproteobacteria bacterium]MBU1646934.1 patatin-like phospholipase family protein [Gammaproteobacteria bacterium]MBU1972446.1 patatin-like phospholipase family protein [Gammaproteobacteria bacterium]